MQSPLTNAIVLTASLVSEVVPWVPTISGAQLVTVYGLVAWKLKTFSRV